MRTISISLLLLSMGCGLLLTSGCIVWSTEKDISLKPTYARPTSQSTAHLPPAEFENDPVARVSSANQPASVVARSYSKALPID